MAILLIVVASAQVQNDAPGFVTRIEFLALKNKVDILTKQLEVSRSEDYSVSIFNHSFQSLTINILLTIALSYKHK